MLMNVRLERVTVTQMPIAQILWVALHVPASLVLLGTEKPVQVQQDHNFQSFIISISRVLLICWLKL